MVTIFSTGARRFFFTLLACAVLVGAAPATAHAEHRARMSRDLTQHLTAGEQRMDVIVHGDRASVDALAFRYNLVVRRYLRSGAVLRVNAGQLDALQRDVDVDHLSGDAIIRPADVTTETIGAERLWEGADGLPALVGNGITVAVIDSGIDTMHVALRRRVLATVDFTGGDGSDQYGHGTHVAGIIAGAGGQTPDTRTYRGVAPRANLLNLRVLGADGSGKASDLIDAIDWAIDHKNVYRIRVINLSLGSPVLQSYHDDPICEAVERAVRAGIVVVVAAGNFGKLPDGTPVVGGITSPGNSPFALTVGALDAHATPDRSDDTVATYSSRGPTQIDHILKPDLVAPGSHVVSAEAASSFIATTHPELHVAGSGHNAYLKLSGTSMATGVVSGAVALLLDERPALDPLKVRVVSQLTSTFLPAAGLVGGGAGSLNAEAAAEVLWKPGSSATVGSGVAFVTGQLRNGAQQPDHRSSRLNRTQASTVAHSKDESIVWGQSGSIVWGQSDSIGWGQLDSIVWGQADSIVWGQLDSTVWGQADSIAWGQ